jgi:hypothetical protein
MLVVHAALRHACRQSLQDFTARGEPRSRGLPDRVRIADNAPRSDAINGMTDAGFLPWNGRI